MIEVWQIKVGISTIASLLRVAFVSENHVCFVEGGILPSHTSSGGEDHKKDMLHVPDMLLSVSCFLACSCLLLAEEVSVEWLLDALGEWKTCTSKMHFMSRSFCKGCPGETMICVSSCGVKFAVSHAMVCHTGGLIANHMSHWNPLLTASLLTEVCHTITMQCYPSNH